MRRGWETVRTLALMGLSLWTAGELVNAIFAVLGL